MTYKITALTPFVPNILDDGSVLNADNHQISLPRDLQAEFMHKPGGQFFSFGVIDADDPQDLIQYTATALVYTASGRVGLASNGSADWGDYDGAGEAGLIAAINDWLNDADAWEARN